MNNEQILMCVVALILGMLLANMLKSVCGCKVVEGQFTCSADADCFSHFDDLECPQPPDGLMMCDAFKQCRCFQPNEAQLQRDRGLQEMMHVQNEELVYLGLKN